MIPAELTEIYAKISSLADGINALQNKINAVGKAGKVPAEDEEQLNRLYLLLEKARLRAHNLEEHCPTAPDSASASASSPTPPHPPGPQ